MTLTTIESAQPEMLRAFEDVPRAFWRAVPLQHLAGMLEIGRLTLPERQHLWRLLAREGETPRELGITFSDADRAALGNREDGPAYMPRVAALLERLQAGKRR